MAEVGGSTESKAGGQSIAWPWYVRWLAVAYVLSMLAGPVGFLVLGGVAAYRISWGGAGFDRVAVVAVAAAWAWLLACGVFRWWFRGWGRRRWPDAEPGAATDPGGTHDS
jgi:hypothetical protein